MADLGGFILGSSTKAIKWLSYNPIDYMRCKKSAMFKLKKIREKYADILASPEYLSLSEQERDCKILRFNRAVNKIHNFVRSKILFGVVNMAQEDIDTIPSIYRLRFFIPKVEDIELIEQMYSLQTTEAEMISDPDIRKIRIAEIENEKNGIITCMISSATNLPVMIDIRIYGMDVKIPVNIGGEMYDIPNSYKEKIKMLHRYLDEESTSGIRFRQMLTASKCLRDAYSGK